MLYLLLAILAILILAGIIYLNTGLGLPANVNQLVREVMTEELPEHIFGTTGTAYNGKVSIFYEAIPQNGSKKGTVLLVCGLSQTLLDWPRHFWQALVDAGYQVIRYDNRSLGLSDRMPNWNKKDPYTLEDMAKDGMAILDGLNIDKAHIIGMSMGGMIAQRMAISHADRVLSLTSIMSSGYYWDPELTNIPKPFYRQITKLSYRFGPFLYKMENKIKLHLAVLNALEGKGDYHLNDKEILQKALYENTRRKGYSLKTQYHHGAAIQASGSRYEELKQLNLPVLIIHGTDDPLVKFEHAQKYAPMIPNADTLFIQDMGHDLPKVYIQDMMDRIFPLFAKAEQHSKTI